MSTTKLICIFAAVLLDGLAGLAGGLLPREFVHRNIAVLLAFAAGTLMGAAFLDMLPHALEHAAPYRAVAWGLAGFSVFHVTETLIGSHVGGQGQHRHGAVGPMILVGDAIHNATDGVALAAAFLADLRVGLVTSLAIFVHELPHEIGDFAVLLSQGYSRGRALIWLLVVQLMAAAGAAGTVWAAAATAAILPLLLAFSAGGFVYIASANLIPELRSHEHRRLTKLAAFFVGIGLIAGLGGALGA